MLTLTSSLRAELAQDKKKHIVLGMVVSLPTLLIKCNPVTALVVSTGVGIAKEVCDAIHNRAMVKQGKQPIHGVEAGDAIATSAGGILAFLLKLLIGR